MTSTKQIHHKIYQEGLKSEHEVVNLLRSRFGDSVRHSTKEENIYQDIDCYVGKVACSIKTSHTTLRTGNLCFELQQQDAEGNWYPSWFHTGKASVYLIRVGDTIYYILKEQLVEYVAEHGWDSVRQLGAYARAYNQHHRWKNAKVGLVSLQKLLDAKLATAL